MGGCTSKPKVLKGYEAETLKPPAPEKVVEVAKEEEEKATVEKEVEKDQDGIVDDENGSKSRSLGNLFKENEEAKDSSQNVTVKDSEVPEVKPIKAAPVVDAPAKDEAQEVKSSESETVNESDVPEVTPKDAEMVKSPVVDAPAKDNSEEVKPAVEAEIAEISEKKPEEKNETPEEKKQEESKETEQTEN